MIYGQAAARVLCLLPLLWLMPALIAMISAAVLVATQGASVDWVEPASDGLRIVTQLPDGSLNRGFPMGIRMAVPAVVAAILWMARRRAPVLLLLALVAVARAAGQTLSFEVLFNRSPWAIALALVWVAVAGLALGTLLLSDGFTRRLAEGLCAFAVPVFLFQVLQVGRPGGFGPGRVWAFTYLTLAATSLPPVLMAALRGRRGEVRMGAPMRWAAAGVAASLVVGNGVWWGMGRARAAERVRLERELAEVPAVAESATYDRVFFQRGVSFVRDGFAAYYPARTAKLFDALRSHGVDSVAVIPYGRASTLGDAVRFDSNPENRAVYQGLARLAHGRGMRVLLKPQLMVFPGMFPGAIDVGEEQRAAWFESYTRFVVYWAQIASAIHADLFCVGTELVKMSRHEREWRDVIARVRAVYAGPLVYAATQGEEFESLRFWDALDYIGLNNYYPLPDSLDTTAVVAKVEAVQKRFGKPVIFTESGYASVEGSHRQPWAEPVAPVALDHQVRCYQALFRAFYHKPWFYGMYWWKISADGRGGPEDRSLTPWRKPAMKTIAEWYGGPRVVAGGLKRR